MNLAEFSLMIKYPHRKLITAKLHLKHLGFTLIELLVVITIIGTLISVATVAFNNVQEKGRDTRRKNDLSAIKSALTLYFEDNYHYPEPGENDLVADSTGGDSWIPGLAPQYIQKLPKDPKQAGLISGLADLFEDIGGVKDLISRSIAKLYGLPRKFTGPQIAGVMSTKWTPFLRGADQFITDLSVDPANADHAYISIDITVPRVTKNKGQNWYIPNDPDFGVYPNKFTSWSILVSPHRTADGKPIIFSGGKDASIFRSNDGDNWEKVKAGAGNLIISLAGDPNSPNNYYAANGTTHDLAWKYGGEPDAAKVLIFKSSQKGDSGTWSIVYTNSIKETDAGFDPATMIPAGRSIFSIEVKKGDSNTLFVADEKGLFKSTNGGTSFTRITVDSFDPAHYVGDTQIDPDDPNKMWATLRMKGVYFSNDGGNTFSSRNSGLSFDPGSYFGFQRLFLVKYSDGTKRLYVTNGAEGGQAGGLWVSNNLGPDDEVTGWTKLTNWGTNISYNWSGNKGLYYVAVAKDDPDLLNRDRIWVGMRSGHVYRSDDRGASWQYVSAREKRITSDLGVNDYYIGNTGIALEGLEWITADPHDSDRLYMGDTDHGLFVSVDGGENGRALFGKTAGNGAGDIVVDPADKNKLYLASFQRQDQKENKGAVYYSTDRGKNWTMIGGGINPDSTPKNWNGLSTGSVLGLETDLSSSASNRVLIAIVDGRGIYRGRYIGPNPDNWEWQPFGLNSNPGPGLTDLTIDPTDPKRMYVTGPGGGFLDYPRGYPIDDVSSGIYRCDDITLVNPNCWVRIDGGSSGLARLAVPDALAIDAIDPQRIYSVGEGGTWTRDGTGVWSEIKFGGSSVANGRGAVAIAEGGKSVLYIASLSRGILRSENQGVFTTFNEVEFQDPETHSHDLSFLNTRDIGYDPNRNLLLVSTEGSGAYKLQLIVASPTPTPTPTPTATPEPSPSPSPSPTPTPGDCSSQGIYCYVVAANLQSYTLWAQLENTADPEATCTGGPAGFNYCLKSE